MTLLSYKNMVEGQGRVTVTNRIMQLSYSFMKGKVYLHLIKKKNPILLANNVTYYALLAEPS